MKWTIAVAGLLLIGHCVAEDTATVRVYRLRRFSSSLVRLNCVVNGKVVTKLHGGEYTDVQLPAGKHDFQSNDKQQHVVLELKPATLTYMLINCTGIQGVNGRPSDICLVDPANGEAETRNLKAAK